MVSPRAPSPDPGAESGEFDPLASETRKAVAVLGEFHLETTLVGVSVLSEDVEDQSDPVDDIALERLLEIALLSRREFVVEHDHVDIEHVRLGD